MHLNEGCGRWDSSVGESSRWSAAAAKRLCPAGQPPDPASAPPQRPDRRAPADTTLIDLAAGGTPVDFQFAYMLSAQAKLVLTAHEVYLPKPKLAVEGPGGVQASFDFREERCRGQDADDHDHQ